jgi:hypothetical protein
MNLNIAFVAREKNTGTNLYNEAPNFSQFYRSKNQVFIQSLGLINFHPFHILLLCFGGIVVRGIILQP